MMIKQYKRLKLIKKTIEFFELILENINHLKCENNEEEVYHLTLIQFFIIMREDLSSIYLLLKKDQLYTANIILRHILEYVVTLAYLQLDPIKNIRQFILFSDVSNLRVLNDEYFPGNDLLTRKSFLKKRVKNFKNETDNWPHLKCRAKLAGLGEIYAIGYRYLCTFSHPDSNNSNFVFTESETGKVIFHKPKSMQIEKIVNLCLEYSFYFIEVMIAKYHLDLFQNKFMKIKNQKKSIL